ncbi:MAG: corrinoid protein [Planctomycetia bacterium]|nr:corrinoid protein [Planctomycetia bacterium]
MSETSQQLYDAVLAGEVETTVTLVNTILQENSDPRSILEESLFPAMVKAGELYDEGEYFLPDLAMAANAMKEAMALLEPLLKNSGVEKLGTVIIGTVKGDHHDIGKNLVASMLEGNGFEVIDLGYNASADKFVEAVRKFEGPVLIALSALLTITMPQMKVVIDRFAAEGLRDRVRFMIGGAPVTQDYADQISADGYSDSANAAVVLAKKLIASF